MEKQKFYLVAADALPVGERVRARDVPGGGPGAGGAVHRLVRGSAGGAGPGL